MSRIVNEAFEEGSSVSEALTKISYGQLKQTSSVYLPDSDQDLVCVCGWARSAHEAGGVGPACSAFEEESLPFIPRTLCPSCPDSARAPRPHAYQTQTDCLCCA